MLNNQRGFTLIEILVAIFLMAIVLATVDLGSKNEKDVLKETLDLFDRSIRFASNDATLLNKITRIHINLNKSPAEFSVQNGHASNFLLPKTKDLSNLSLREQEEEAKKQKQLNQNFSNSSEINKEPFALPEDLFILGVGYPSLDKIQIFGEQSIYFYPSGEKDSAIIFFSGLNEFAAYQIDSFIQDTKVFYHTYTEYERNNLESSQKSLMEESFNKWKKD